MGLGLSFRQHLVYNSRPANGQAQKLSKIQIGLPALDRTVVAAFSGSEYSLMPRLGSMPSTRR
jgi:hypothetical protein